MVSLSLLHLSPAFTPSFPLGCLFGSCLASGVAVGSQDPKVDSPLLEGQSESDREAWVVPPWAMLLSSTVLGHVLLQSLL